MKRGFVTINLLFISIDAFLIVTGFFDWNHMVHGHLLNLFVGQSDGKIGLFWLICIIHDLLLLNGLLLAIHCATTWRSRA